MSPTVDSQELPNCLREMIADAKAAVERWQDDADETEGEVHEIVDACKEWAVRLSHGKYDDDLYWECVAQDCEEAGNWDGAKSAYGRILSGSQDSFKRPFAFSSLGGLCSILGEQQQALAHFHSASECERRQISNIFYRHYLATEAGQLLLMGRVRAAKRLSIRGLATFEVGDVDNLGFARLKIVIAACEVEQRRLVKAGDSLSDAWSALESLPTINGHSETDLGSGVHSALSRWWRIEAKRRQLAGQTESEVEAWRNSLDQARRGAAGWNRLGWDIAIIWALESLAEANSRTGHIEECISARAEAATLRNRWHLPANDNPPLEPSTFIRRLRTMLPFSR